MKKRIMYRDFVIITLTLFIFFTVLYSAGLLAVHTTRHKAISASIETQISVASGKVKEFANNEINSKTFTAFCDSIFIENDTLVMITGKNGEELYINAGNKINENSLAVLQKLTLNLKNGKGHENNALIKENKFICGTKKVMQSNGQAIGYIVVCAPQNRQTAATNSLSLVILGLFCIAFVATTAACCILRAKFLHEQELKNTFISNVSHEMRTPLTVIKGFVENLQDSEDKLSLEKRNEIYRILDSEINRLAKLISDMRLLSKQNSGTLKVPTEPLDISYCLGEFETYIESICKAKNISLTHEAAAQAIALFNYDAFRQMLIILCDNAVKHTPQGGEICLMIKPASEISKLSGGKKCVLSNSKVTPQMLGSRYFIGVADSGGGIEEIEQKKIFKRFYTAGTPHKTSTGIGLSLASEMMATIGETMVVISKPGKGSVIGFTLLKFNESYASGDDIF